MSLQAQLHWSLQPCGQHTIVNRQLLPFGGVSVSAQQLDRFCLSVDEETGLCPKVALDCFSLVLCHLLSN